MAYRLSASLGPLPGPARALCVLPGSSSLVVGTQTGDLCAFGPQEAGFPHVRTVRDVHRGKLLFVIAPAAEAGAVLSGGGDSLVRCTEVLTTGAEAGRPRQFPSQVCSLTDGAVGCWDGSPFPGIHQHGTEVLRLPDGSLAAASAGGLLTVHGHGGEQLAAVEGAARAPFRKLAPHPLGFAAASNDGYARVFDSRGTLLLEVLAHPGAADVDSFCYGVAALPDGGLVTCGEDATVRLWAPDGSPRQTVRHPAAVRAVLVLPSGDIVTACSDRVARVFTADPARSAPADEIEAFRAAAEAQAAAIDPSTLTHERDLLAAPGEKDGQVRMAQGDGRAWVYRWQASTGSWEKVGEAVGRAQQRQREVVDGRECDHVTDVYVTEDRSVRLGWCRDDDPDEVARAFCARHGLGPDMWGQVADHIRPMVDARSRGGAAAAAAPAAPALRQTPSWRTGGYHTFSGVRTEALSRRALEAGDFASDSERDTFRALVAAAAAESVYHVASLPDAQARLLTGRLLSWRNAAAVPALDLYRALMLHQDACKKCGLASAGVADSLAALASDPAAPAHAPMLVARAATNWMAKQRGAGGVTAEQAVAAVSRVAAAVTGGRDGSWPAAYAYLAHNAVRWWGSVRGDGGDALVAASAGLLPVVLPPLARGRRPPGLGPRPLFYALLAAASAGVAAAGPEGRAAVVELLGGREAVEADVRDAAASAEAPVREAGKDLEAVLLAGR